MLAYLTRLIPGLPRSAPDSTAVIPYVRDNANPAMRDMRGMTLDQLASALGGAVGSAAGAFSAAEIAAYQEEAAAYSDAVTRRTVALSQPDAQLVLWLAYGQSLSLGTQSWPAPTRVQAAPDLFMMGTSVHSQTSNTVWSPLGGGGLNPLVGTVVYTNTPLTDEQVVALDLNAAPNGETPLEGFLAQLRPAWLASRGTPAGNANNRWVAAACGIGGTSLAGLSKGAPQEKFNRLRGAITSAKAIADANGWTFKVGGMVFVQGEEDYQIDTAYAEWLSLFTTFVADFREYAVSQTGQAGIIPIFLAQTGGISARDSLELAVGRAQVAAASIPGVYVAASTAPVPDKGTHLTGHGSRMLGVQLGKAAVRALVHGEGYEAARAVRWVYRDRTLLGVFHAPVAPLRLATAYNGRTAVPPPADAGIYVSDGAGQNAVTGPAIVGGRLVVAQLARAPAGTCRVWLGRRAAPYNGIVSFADSDMTRMAAGYSYAAGNGQWESENIEALVGLSYPAAGFALADVQTAQAV